MSSGIPQRPNMARQFLLNVRQDSPWPVIILFCQGNRKVFCKSVKMTDDGSANLFVSGGPRPKVRWCSAGNARNSRKRRCAEFLVFLDEDARPIPQVVEQPVELRMQRMVLRNLSVGLFYFLNDINDLAQDVIEGAERIVR